MMRRQDAIRSLVTWAAVNNVESLTRFDVESLARARGFARFVRSMRSLLRLEAEVNRELKQRRIDARWLARGGAR